MFKKGDKVRCINNTGLGAELTIGEVYTVIDTESLPDTVRILNDCKDEWVYSNSRFELVDDSSSQEEDIQKPQRYNKGSIEVWDFIIDQNMGFLEGNVIKYLSRFKDKGGLKDLEKALVYLEKLIEVTKTK